MNMRYQVSFNRLGFRHVVVVEAPSSEAASINVQRAASTMMSSPTIDSVVQVDRTTPLSGMNHSAFRHAGFTNS